MTFKCYALNKSLPLLTDLTYLECCTGYGILNEAENVAESTTK